MPKKPLNKEDLRREYEEVRPKYEKLAINLSRSLETFLHEAGIEVVDVKYRVKDFDSFWDKIQRKNYQDPFQETEDICGLRIICFYPSDLDKISRIINREFDVKESIGQVDLRELDRFGYRSLHFILTAKQKWLDAPNYRGLDGLRAEVQVRTILMHAWADIEYKLAYKKKEHVPDQLKRKLYQLSALFELADEQFDSLRKDKEQYREDLVSEEAKKSGRFDVTQEMNLDTLQAFLDFYFPDRYKSLEWTSGLLDEIIKHKISIRQLVQGYEKVKHILPSIEMGESRDQVETRWTQVGITRWILDLTNDDYWESRKSAIPSSYVELREKGKPKSSEGDC